MKDLIGAIGGLGCALLVVIALVIGGSIGGIWWLNTFGVAQANAQRNVTTHSQQYVTTHQQMLMSWYADYQSATASGDAAHAAGAKVSICTQYTLLDPGELPAAISAFVATECN